MANSNTKIKGNAAAIEAVCNASRPPANSSDVASKDCTNPQINCLLFEGFKSPCDDNIPSTNVAEFADVIKNVLNNTTVIIDSTMLKG